MECNMTIYRSEAVRIPNLFCLIWMLALLLALDPGMGSMPWDRWSWAAPQAPIAYFFRRHQVMPVKSPSYQCQCPPNKDCVLDFKINEDTPEFLKLRGLMKDEDIKEFRKEVQKTKIQLARRGNVRSRRQNKECCCPPRSMLMPTFITNKKFDEIAKRLQNK